MCGILAAVAAVILVFIIYPPAGLFILFCLVVFLVIRAIARG